MFVYQPNEWAHRRQMILRILVSCVVFITALLVYPIATLVFATVAFAIYGAYEGVVAGVLLDAVLAPGTGMLGEYTYTATLVILAVCMYMLRRVVSGTRAE